MIADARERRVLDRPAFQTYALAVQWADLEREALERDGWTISPT